MKTTFEPLIILYHLFVGSPVDSAITGGIYQMKRPSGSTLEDVVINSLPISGTQIQQVVANVNLYVPDLKLTLKGKPQQMPDMNRLNELATLAIPLIKEHYQGNYQFWLVGQTVIEEPETGQHYVNLRVEFQFLPTF